MLTAAGMDISDGDDIVAQKLPGKPSIDERSGQDPDNEPV